MTNQEFSNEFDVLYNNIMSNQAPGLDEYEKSVFLTKALEEIVLSLYNGKNPFNESFEQTEEIRRYLDLLIITYICEPITNKKDLGLSKYSLFFELPKDIWFITYESVLLSESISCDTNEIMIIPITLDEYHRIKNNPFRGLSNKRALRLDSSRGEVEIITHYNNYNYKLRYLSRPLPIILEDLGDRLTISGISIETECKLNPALHNTILYKAVQLASASYKL